MEITKKINVKIRCEGKYCGDSKRNCFAQQWYCERGVAWHSDDPEHSPPPCGYTCLLFPYKNGEPTYLDSEKGTNGKIYTKRYKKCIKIFGDK